jgi:hypothetical protein
MFLQNTRYLQNGIPRGEHIVNHKDPPVSDEGILVHFEGTRHIRMPLGPRQGALRDGGANTARYGFSQRQARFLLQVPEHLGGLVEFTLSQTGRMERNRHDRIEHLTGVIPVVTPKQQPRQGSRQAPAPVKFVRVENLPHGGAVGNN